MSDAVLLIAFGGPEKMDDVRPFLDNVLRGRPVPPERLADVVHHYELIGGRSPLNELTRSQAAALRERLPDVPVYIGMRNWTPYLHETLAQMQRDGVTRATGFIMSAQQSEAGWDRYQQDVANARSTVGPPAPEIDFVEGWPLHPLFIQAVVARTRGVWESLPPDRRADARLIFTAHSIPMAMAARAPYAEQVTAGSRLVADQLGAAHWRIAYQSRSGNPRDPWLEPDINDALRAEAAAGARDVVVVPIGFVCDHVEVLYDLDIEARQTAAELGLTFARARAVNDHPLFIDMMVDVIRGHRAQGEKHASG